MPNSSPNMRRTIKALTEGQHVRNAHAAMLLLLAERQGPHMLVATVDLVAQQKYGAKTLDERLALRPALYGLLGFAKGGNRPFFIARYLRSARSFMDFDKRLTELAKVFAEDSEVISLGARTHPYWVRRGDPSWLVD